MNSKLVLAALTFGIVAVTGCSAPTEEEATTESDLIAPEPPAKVQGAWRAKVHSSPGFQGVVFHANGTFFADVNTGIMCITTPCPTTARLEGTYAVVGRHLFLEAKPGAEDGYGFYDHFRVTRSGDALRLERDGQSLGTDLSLETSYCGEPTDCEGQGLIHPMCLGSWTCSEQRSCGYACGVTSVAASE